MSTKKCESKNVDDMLINNKKSNKLSDKISDESSNKSINDSLDDLLENLPKNKCEKKPRKHYAKKNEKYESKQLELFNKIKVVLDIKDNTFLSFTVKSKFEELKIILDDVHKYYHSSLWYGVKYDESQGCMRIIRHLFKHHKFNLLSKETSKPDNGKYIRGRKYFIVPM